MNPFKHTPDKPKLTREEEAQLLRDLRQYQGDNPVLIIASLALQLCENPELDADMLDFVRLYQRLPEHFRPTTRAVLLLAAGRGTETDRQIILDWIEQHDHRGRSHPMLRELAEKRGPT